MDGTFSLELLKQAPFPEDLTALGEDGIRQIWHDAKLRGRGYSRAGEILQYAKTSVGIKDGAAAGKTAVQWFVQKIMELDDEFHRMMYQITDKMQTYLMVKNMNIHYDRFRELKLHTSIATTLLDEHKEILNAIISKNGATAKELVINHLSRINADEKEIRKKYGEFFK